MGVVIPIEFVLQKMKVSEVYSCVASHRIWKRMIFTLLLRSFFRYTCFSLQSTLFRGIRNWCIVKSTSILHAFGIIQVLSPFATLFFAIFSLHCFSFSLRCQWFHLHFQQFINVFHVEGSWITRLYEIIQTLFSKKYNN